MTERRASLVSLNQTNQTDTSLTLEQIMYARTELVSGCILGVLSPITVTANILLITAISKDPLKYFKKPTSHFVLGLSVADLICGLLVEPLFAMYFFCRYFQACAHFHAILRTLFIVASIISTASLNSSFVMVLMLSVVQLIAIEWPYRYKTWVKKKTVITCVVITWVYFGVFSLLPILGVDQVVFFQINLILHSTLVSVVLAFVQILVYRAFRGHLQHQSIINRYSFLLTGSPHNTAFRQRYKKHLAKKQTRYKLFDRNFIIVTFYLAAILLFSAFPHIAVFYVFLYKEPTGSLKEELYLNISLRITDLLLFTKVAADAFIFAWRLPTYRKSLDFIITGKTPKLETEV